ncbi:unnamed protein product [Rotaria sp. Silwood2]|nr:unnamed protein product [Rotaria sp. Silwood2]
MSDINFLPLTVVQKLEDAGIPQDSLIFYQDHRWVYQVGQEISDNNKFHYQPMDSLGPFGEHLMTFSNNIFIELYIGIHEVDILFDLISSTFQYRITKIRGRQLTDEEQIIGSYAPIASITLEGCARSTANIPDDATHFCWLYPAKCILSEDDDVTSRDSDESNLLKIGGFAYFNTDDNNIDKLRLIRLNSLSLPAKNGLTFKDPYSWRKQYTHRLWAENRFQPVTLPYLLEKGARYFAFINPSEKLSTENNELSWIPSENGAFAYLFNEDHSPHVFDCYFSVADNCLGVSPSDEE